MMESQDPIGSREAAELMEGAERARLRMAHAVEAPAGELLHYAVAVAALIAGGAFSGWYERTSEVPVGGAALVMIGVSLGLLGTYIGRFRRRTGLVLNSTRPPRARWVAWLVVPLVGALFYAAYDAGAGGDAVRAVVAVVLAVPAMYRLSRWWEREYVRGVARAR